MRNRRAILLLLALVPSVAGAQGAVPTFQVTVGEGTYALLGKDPAGGRKTTIPTLLVPLTLTFHTARDGGRTFVMDAAAHVERLRRSPVFADTDFPIGGKTQYVDALLRAIFPQATQWHTRLGKPKVEPLRIDVPPESGYVLTSRASGRAVAVVDVEWLQAQLAPRLQEAKDRLVIAVTLNTTFYADSDATICCSWGTHGVDTTTGASFVLGTILHDAPAVVTDVDLQPLTQQLAQFAKDPLNDPLAPHRRRRGDGESPNNAVPGWMRPDGGGCGGTGVASSYFLLEPTDTNPKNHFPTSVAYEARVKEDTYFLHNVATLPWYTGTEGDLGSVYSFPDPFLLTTPAERCPERRRREGGGGRPPAAQEEVEEQVQPIAAAAIPTGHKLIGYWAGYGSARSTIPLRDISPQWDVVLVAFGTVDGDAPEGTITFRPPSGMDPEEFRADVAYLKGRGTKVMVSLGGAGQHFSLEAEASIANFVESVGEIVSTYGFDGIDIDFETPSLSTVPGDTDPRHPTSPTTVHFIAALRQLHERFGDDCVPRRHKEGAMMAT